MKKVGLHIKGRPVEVVADDKLVLLDLLRNTLGLTGTKQSCDRRGQCGACTVIVIGRIDYTLVGFDPEGFIDPERIASALRANTSLVVVNYASNVLGSIQPVADIGRICAERGVPLLIDMAAGR